MKSTPIGDLNIPLAENNQYVAKFGTYQASASNVPDTNAGTVLTMVATPSSWALQFAFTLGGSIYYRMRNNSGTISGWTKKI